MAATRFVQFVATVGAVSLVTAVAGAALAPPDPVTHLRWLAAGVGLALPVAYVLAYRGGYETLSRWAANEGAD